jgi:outer membrane receptor protein involved in Fe transport
MTARVSKPGPNGCSTLYYFCFWSLATALTALAATATQAQEAEPYQEPRQPTEVATSQTTVVYGQDFFAKYPNAVSVLDLIKRIPGTQPILNSGNDDNRGFSSNDDRILINGKRMSGKSNDSESALGRITLDKVLRVEIIRGSSPDVKVSGQEAILNIVLKEGAATKGSGSWRADARVTKGPEAGFGGFLSYGGALGDLDYFASFETIPRQRRFDRFELLFDPDGVFLGRLNEISGREHRETKLTTNLSYSFNGDTTLRLNGQYIDLTQTIDTNGERFAPDPMGGPLLLGPTHRNETFDKPEFEIGGDFETSFGSNWTFKLLALYSREDQTEGQKEDFLITNGEPVDDFEILLGALSSEMIGRTSLTWTASPAHSIEFGSEMAINRLTSLLEFSELQGGVLVPVDIPGADTKIKETRNESFIVHTWKINHKASLESSLFTEYSKIQQTGDFMRSRTFFFLKPSTDFRYNFTPRDQLQLSARRKVQQLDFGDFASSTSGDDEVVAGNANLKPEKRWQFEASFEHRFANDGGRIKFEMVHEIRQDLIDRLEIAPGVSGNGNIGTGTRDMIAFEGSFRMIALGLRDLVIEPRVGLTRTRVRDSFTDEKRLFNRWNWNYARVRVRHDLTKLGLSYGLELARYGRWNFNDIDELIEFPSMNRVEMFIEKQLFSGMVLRFEAFELTNPDQGRVRTRFDAGIATGVVTNREFRAHHEGRRYQISLRGTF